MKLYRIQYGENAGQLAELLSYDRENNLVLKVVGGPNDGIVETNRKQNIVELIPNVVEVRAIFDVLSPSVFLSLPKNCVKLGEVLFFFLEGKPLLGYVANTQCFNSVGLEASFVRRVSLSSL